MRENVKGDFSNSSKFLRSVLPQLLAPSPALLVEPGLIPIQATKQYLKYVHYKRSML